MQCLCHVFDFRPLLQPQLTARVVSGRSPDKIILITIIGCNETAAFSIIRLSILL